MPYTQRTDFFLSIFKEEPLSLFEIPAATILNSGQWTVGIDDVSRLLAPIFAVWIGKHVADFAMYHLDLQYSFNLDLYCYFLMNFKKYRATNEEIFLKNQSSAFYL